MNPNDTSAPVWRVIHNTFLNMYVVERAVFYVSRYESLVSGGLTYDEARALARLLNSGERDEH